MRRFACLRRGLRAVAVAPLLAPLLALCFSPAQAQTAEQIQGVLDRVAATGVLNAGSRTDAAPFASLQADGKFAGLAVDVMEEIRAAVEARVKRPVELRLHAVTPADRIQKVRDGSIDVECGITTPTWDREALVDFTIPFFGNGTRIMALRGPIKTLDDLNGKRIGVIKGSTTVGIVAAGVHGATLVEVSDMETGLAQLERGEVDGLSNLGIVLRAQVEKTPLKSRVLMLPRTGALSYESIACMTPKGDSVWRDTVNRALADMLEGVDQYRGAFIKLHDRWLGPGGPVYYPLDRSVAQRLAASVIWLK